MKNKKTIVLIIALVVVLTLTTTLSFFVWNSTRNQDINVSVNLSGLDAFIHYNKGTDVLTGTLLPSTDYTGGISTEIELWKDPSAESRTIYGHIYMDITSIGTNLANEPALKWAITSNNNVLNTGDFVGKSNGNSIELSLNIPLSTTKQLYQVYIWLDESMNINDAIEGETIATVVRAEASEVMYAQNASQFITSLLYYNPNTMNNDDPDNNVRYMGANPNNYIDIGDRYPEGFTVGKWEELGAPFQTVDECKEYFNCSVNYGNLGFSSEEECNTELPGMLEEGFGVSSVDEFNNTYCVVEDKSNEPILWRIIGVFDVASTYGGPTEKRIKIIRDEPIGKYSWDNKPSGTGSSDSEYGSNDWTDSALKEVLNNGAYWNKTSGTCPRGQNGATTSCDFSGTGLTEEAKSLIGDAVWNLGGTELFLSASDGLPSHFYGYERGTTVYTGRPTYWVGKIGLMYPSDYGYATSGGTTTNRESCLAKRMSVWNNYSDCYENDYLYNSSLIQWTMTHDASLSSRVFIVTEGTPINGNYASNGNGVHPTAYLKSNVLITGGDGSQTSPYVLEVE